MFSFPLKTLACEGFIKLTLLCFVFTQAILQKPSTNTSDDASKKPAATSPLPPQQKPTEQVSIISQELFSCYIVDCYHLILLYPLLNQTSWNKILWSLEIIRMGVKKIQLKAHKVVTLTSVGPWVIENNSSASTHNSGWCWRVTHWGRVIHICISKLGHH